MIEWVASFRSPSIEAIEENFRATLAVKDAVLLPSVRAGILGLLRLRSPPGALVVAPAYTCLVVHEAIAASRATARYLEPQAENYLMSVHDMVAAGAPGCAFVLSEMYGIPYSSDDLATLAKLHPSVVIIDSAMGIPSAERLQALRANEVALFSFGMGKSLCAGGGGIALFGDASAAAQLRAERDRVARKMSVANSISANLQLLAGMLLRSRMLSRHASTLRHRLKASSPRAAASAHKDTHVPSIIVTNPAWTSPMTALQRRLAAWNLRRLSVSRELRRVQALRYMLALHPDHGEGQDASRTRLPQSHFPFRVSSELRSALRDRLKADGFDTGDEFSFSGLLRQADHPMTKKIADEIITLPLGEMVSMREIDQLCRTLSGHYSAMTSDTRLKTSLMK